MRRNRKSLENSKLYLILDADVCDYGRLWDILKAAVPAGVDIVQLRDKKGSARDILQFSAKVKAFLKGRIPYIVNDRVDLALASGAAGVHLGQEDLPVAVARKILGRKAIIGVSCQSLGHIQKALKDGADYIGFGSVFKTKTKPGRDAMDLTLLTKVVRKAAPVPVFAIGGINVNRAALLQSLGVRRVAVCRAICEAGQIAETVRNLRTVLNLEVSRG